MASTYTPIATTTVSGSTTSAVTFNSFSGYTDLRLIISHALTTGTGSPLLTFNSDTGTNYSYSVLYGNGTSALSARATSTAYIVIGNCDTNFNISNVDINNYSNSTTYKTALSRGATPALYTSAWVGLWRNTAAITSLTVTSPSPAYWAAGSTFTLYGIKAA